jgi:3-oxoacyl-[acyl-carrier protein] reductase
MTFAQEGARVVINGRHADSLRETADAIKQETGAQVHAVTSDVATAEGCQQLIREAVQAFGQIDALVVNAGGPPSKSFTDLTDEDWEAGFQLTLMSAVRLIRAALPHLQERQGSIVAITSTSVKQPIPGLMLSNSLRPGVVGLGKTLAEELAEKGVRFNDVGPGATWTGRQEYLVRARAEREGIPEAEVIRQGEEAIPMKRYGQPEEVANVIVFLASPAAAYVTGQTVMADGGATKGLL